jgi:PTH2 family peptidyl-tRNA hydrolase
MDEYKQVLVIRKDLVLSPGKVAAQAAHASLEAYKRADAKAKARWEDSGSKKVVVKVAGLKELMEIYQQAKDYKLPCSLINDAGKTELPAGTTTAAGIGPAAAREIDRVTGHLKML